ncbi:MAG: alpha/beta hydrolase [Actinobacteria bacterium]|nr:alpha/beta hydrolase [Actinomycetota bacterium]
MSVVLVHSPLVGPSSWALAAEVLGARGFDVALPDLTVVASSPPPQWEAFVEVAVAGAASLTGPTAVVGHSGAGAFLPEIADRVSDAHMVFVDAVLPPGAGVHETPPAMRRQLDEQTVDGRLRPWLEWWPEQVVEELIPDPLDRAEIAADMASLPRSFYDEAVPVPDGWSRGRCSYLKLSDAYDAEFAEAGARSWPRSALDADHLAIRTQPVRVVDAVESLLDARW